VPHDEASLSEAEAAGRARPSILAPLVAVLLIPAVLGSSQTIFNDGDVSWHIATGRWILEHGRIPTTDPFSFTWAGKPWVPIEWLAEVIYASAYGLAGYAGVAAVVTAALVWFAYRRPLPGDSGGAVRSSWSRSATTSQRHS
jgi:hypothetical protein